MKLIHTLTTLSILTLSTVANADCAKCDKETCQTKQCEKKASCTTCDSDQVANQINLSVTGMTCEGCSSKITKSLKATEGVTLHKVCHKSGHVVFTFDPAKTNKTKVISAINTTGFKVVGENLTIPVTGMTCGGCTKKVTTALKAIEGCQVTKVCHKSGHAVVTIDTAKISKQQIVEAINKTGFKAQETKKAPAASTKE